MAHLRRELYRQVKGPEITHADCCTLVFDTDAKNLYVEREVAHLDMTVEGAIEIQTATMDIADYLKQGGQTAGHRELWRLLRKIFKEDCNSDELVGQSDQARVAATRHFMDQPPARLTAL
jgi:hypothetical protein